MKYSKEVRTELKKLAEWSKSDFPKAVQEQLQKEVKELSISKN